MRGNTGLNAMERGCRIQQLITQLALMKHQSPKKIQPPIGTNNTNGLRK